MGTHDNAESATAEAVIERWFLDFYWMRYVAWCLNHGEVADQRFHDNAASKEQAQVHREQLLEALATAGFQVARFDGTATP